MGPEGWRWEGEHNRYLSIAPCQKKNWLAFTLLHSAIIMNYPLSKESSTEVTQVRWWLQQQDNVFATQRVVFYQYCSSQEVNSPFNCGQGETEISIYIKQIAKGATSFL